MDNNELIKKLEEHPELRKHIEELLGIAGDSCEGVDLADDAEEKTILAVRNIGKQALQDWADNRADRASTQLQKQVSSAKKNIKKKSTGKPVLGK